VPGILDQLLRNLAHSIYHNLEEVLQAEIGEIGEIPTPPYPSAASPRSRRTPPLGKSPGDRRQPRPGQPRTKKAQNTAPPPPHIPGFSALDTAYAVLGVGSEADRKEVRVRYMGLVKEVAVDRGGSPTRAALVNAAYQAVCEARGWKK